MAVNNVNNSNAGISATSAALIGGGAGIAAGYLTRPFLKDGAPTDEFIKKTNENLKGMMTPKQKKIAESAENYVKNIKSTIINAKSVEELRDASVDILSLKT